MSKITAVIFTCVDNQKKEQHYLKDSSLIARLEDDFCNGDIKDKLSTQDFELYSKNIGMLVTESVKKGDFAWAEPEKLYDVKVFFENRLLFDGKATVDERYRNICFERTPDDKEYKKTTTIYFNKNMWKKLTITVKG